MASAVRIDWEQGCPAHLHPRALPQPLVYNLVHQFFPAISRRHVCLLSDELLAVGLERAWCSLWKEVKDYHLHAAQGAFVLGKALTG
eukprot:892696-Pelagomonas_calceolata.AAC.4